MTINRLSVRAAFLAVSSAAAVLLSATGCRHSDIVELPLTWHEGFGPFDLSFSGDRAYNPDSDASAPAITGFPDGMSEIRTGIFETNILQTCYEDHIAGRMSDERYGHLLEAWGWIPDTTVLSRNHVDTQIAFAVGKCQDGALCIAVDTDGDSDLSDEKPLVLTETDSLFNSAERDSILSANTVIATVEQYDGKSIKRSPLPLVLSYDSKSGIIFKGMAEHATARHKGVELAVRTDNLAYNFIHVTKVSGKHDWDDAQDEVFAKGDYIDINGKMYRICGIDIATNSLVLENTGLPREKLYSSQPGFYPYPLEGPEFSSGERISLESMKGKYVLLAFWSTGCGPCIREIPTLKELYDMTDRDSLEIIGIAGNSDPDMVKHLIGEHDIAWPQLLSTSDNDIIGTYHVNGYPTNILIGPDGTVITDRIYGRHIMDIASVISGK